MLKWFMKRQLRAFGEAFGYDTSYAVDLVDTDPAAGLVYSVRGLDVQDVWIDGTQRLANGVLLADDAREAVRRAADWKARNSHLVQRSKEVAR